MFTQKIIFTPEECNQIIKYSFKIDNTYDSLIEKNPGINYFAYNIPNTEEYKWVFDRLIMFFIENTNLKLNKPVEVVHLHRYEENCVFAKHHDKNYPSRIWNVGVQLNDDYRGGNLNLFYDEKIRVDKHVGNSYIFRPEVFHEVTKVTRGTRWSLILFLHYENILEEFNKKTLF